MRFLMQNKTSTTADTFSTGNGASSIHNMFDDLLHWIHADYRETFAELISAYELSLDKSEDTSKSEIYRKIEPWLQANLFQHFDSAKIFLVPSRKWTSILRELPGFLVFIPITWTWLCLSQAAGAFYRLTQSDSNTGKYPFLTLWSNGFNGELPTFFGFREFSSVAAFFTVVILATILIANYLLSKWDLQDQEALAEKSRMLSLALSTIDREFSALRLSSPLRFAQSLNQTATALLHLNEAALKNLSKTDETVEALNSISEGISNYVEILNSSFSQVENQLKSSEAANVSLNQNIEKLPFTFAEITNTQKQKIELELERTLKLISDDFSKTRNWSTAQLTALQGLADFVSQLAEKIPELQNMAQELNDTSKVSAVTTNQIAAQFEKLLGALQVVVDRLEKMNQI